MGASATTRSMGVNDRDNPANYATFDDYSEGAASVWSVQEMGRRWNAAHPNDPVRAHGDFQVPPAAPNTGTLSDDGCGVTRLFAAVQLLGGGIEIIVAGGALLAPEPTGVTKVVGVVVLTHGVDTLQGSIRTLVTCDRTATFTQQGASSLARYAGASPKAAETIGVITDVGIGVGGSFAVGALSRVGPGAAQLVHLTSADSAAAIRASETLGLGSTIYAGPESLAQARGWSILARTGLQSSQATEVILLPSEANQAFLLVKPIGPFSAWQSINGTVFSAGAGSFNLTTGAFTRTGVAANQLVIYGTDIATMATMRAAPSLIGASRKP
jgi:hypothetical protein